MKKRANIRNLVLVILSLLCNLQLQAQGSKIYLSDKPGSTRARRVIQLKILTPELYFKDGINIYRKDVNDNEWQKLTEKPLQKAELIEPKSDQDEDYSFYYSVMTATSANENDKNTTDFMILSSLLTNNNFARLCGVYFEDENVKDDHIYSYKITILNNGKETDGAVSAEIKAGDYSRANSPSVIIARRDKKRVFIRWKKEDRFPTWNIYRRDSSGTDFVKVNETPVMIFDQTAAKDSDTWYFQDTTIQEGKTYFYKLSGLDVFTNESELSKEYRIKIADLTPPKAPDTVSFVIKDFEVTLSWKYDHLPKNIKEFNILRSRNMNDIMAPVNKSPLNNNQLNYSDKVPVLNRVYYYAVEVKDFNNNISTSSVIIVNVPDAIAPLAPVIISAIGDTGKVYLTFAKPPEDDFRGFKIYRSLTPLDDDFMLLTPDLHPGLKYIDTIQKTSQVPYYYKIQALDSAFNESKYSNIVKVKLRDILPPAQPFIKNIITDQNGITIEWLPNLEYDLKGYYVYRSTGKDSGKWQNLTPLILDKKLTSYKDIIPLAGITCYYSIAAADSSGNLSEKSNIYSALLPGEISKPQPPANARGKYTKETNEVTLEWSYKPNDDFLGFIVLRREDKDGEYIALTGMINETHFSDKKIITGKVYHYLIKAVNKNGTASGTEVLNIEIK
jgi:uncharacterized protein